jgi:hypothetical protein
MSIDLAQRFEWRLRWEQSQLESWQAYQQNRVQHGDNRSSPTRTEDSHKQHNKSPSQSQLSVDKQTDNGVTRLSDLSLPQQKNLNFNPSPFSQQRHNMTPSCMSSVWCDGVRSAISTAQKVTQNVRATPVQFARDMPSQSLHVYQIDGNVEVTLRCIGLDEKSGVKLMAGLRKDLASLGLRLTRLILNGDLFWTAEPGFVDSGLHDDGNEAPIDKIY